MTVEVPRETKAGRTQGPIILPEELRRALAADATASEAFSRLPPSHQREVVAHVAEARQPDTRERRAARMVDDLRSGRIGGRR